MFLCWDVWGVEREGRGAFLRRGFVGIVVLVCLGVCEVSGCMFIGFGERLGGRFSNLEGMEEIGEWVGG